MDYKLHQMTAIVNCCCMINCLLWARLFKVFNLSLIHLSPAPEMNQKRAPKNRNEHLKSFGSVMLKINLTTP